MQMGGLSASQLPVFSLAVLLFHVIFMDSSYFWRFVNAVLNGAGYCRLRHVFPVCISKNAAVDAILDRPHTVACFKRCVMLSYIGQMIHFINKTLFLLFC